LCCCTCDVKPLPHHMSPVLTMHRIGGYHRYSLQSHFLLRPLSVPSLWYFPFGQPLSLEATQPLENVALPQVHIFPTSDVFIQQHAGCGLNL
jgi:hypothetical protein